MILSVLIILAVLAAVVCHLRQAGPAGARDVGVAAACLVSVGALACFFGIGVAVLVTGLVALRVGR